MSVNQQSNVTKQISTYQQEARRLKQKVAEYEKIIQYSEKQQQKIRELEKVNAENTTRLLQCVSNVRDLLHSNKKLRQQLEKEKQLREQSDKKLTTLQDHIRTQYKIDPPIKIDNDSNQDQQPAGIKSLRNKNMHRANKFQKLSKLKISTKRCNTENINLQKQSSQTAKSPQNMLKQLAQRYQLPSFVIRQEKNRSQHKKTKLSRSVDLKKDDTKYLKAQLKRKLSIKKSNQKYETIQNRSLEQKQ